MDAAKIGIFEKSNKVRFGCFLKSNQGGCLESKFGVKFMCNFSNKSLEWQLSKKKGSALLVSLDFSESNCTRSPPSLFLNSTSCWCSLSCSFLGKGFLGSFTTGCFSCGLFGSGHFVFWLIDFIAIFYICQIIFRSFLNLKESVFCGILICIGGGLNYWGGGQ